MNKKVHQYGKYISVKQKKMHVSVKGKGKKVILLLPGLGDACPIIEMKAMTSILETKYTVVTIEYFGYGLSDDTNVICSADNIVNEIHEAMRGMGYKKYSIAADSISELYCLLYTNLYHDEIDCFVGIDPTPPRAIDVGVHVQKLLLRRLIK